jgi:hypothetical protein
VPYTYSTLVYAGRPEATPTEHYVLGVEEAVMELVEDYAKHHEVKGRNLFCDRFYSTLDLVDRYLILTINTVMEIDDLPLCE